MMQFVKMRCLNVIGILYLITITSGDQPKIVIIGAGVSGIAAASVLYGNGFQTVTILEAEDRIGGRVNTVWFDESWVDLGGQYTHQERSRILFQFAWLRVHWSFLQGTEFTVYNSDGCHMPNSVSGDLIQIFRNITSDDGYDRQTGPIIEHFTRSVNTEIEKYSNFNKTMGRRFMKLFEGLSIVPDASDSWYDVSSKSCERREICPGDVNINWRDRRYGAMLDILMKKFPNPEEELPILNNTILNSEVVNIDYNSTEGKAVVVTSSGQQYIADHVIVTPSLGVLKEQHETLFTPQLPEYKVNIIKDLPFGTIARIFISFEESWWPDHSKHFAFVWEDNDRQEYESDPDKKWLVDVIGVFIVASRPQLLYTWVSGESSQYVEALPEDQVLNQTVALMNKFLGKTHNITRPTGIIRTTWFSNKHFRGAYSFRSTRSERNISDQLAAPLLVNNTPIVLFAGEATYASNYSGFRGGMESGFREANRLKQMYLNTPK